MNNIDKEIELLKLKIQLLEKEIELEKIKSKPRQDLTDPSWMTKPIPCETYIGDVPLWHQTFTEPHSFSVSNAMARVEKKAFLAS
jgi:hypothetical protein